MSKPIGQDSSLNISLPMLFQAVGIIAAMTWGYGELNGRISFLEYQVKINEEHIEAIEEDAKESQNAEIAEQERRIQDLEDKVTVLNASVEGMETQHIQKLEEENRTLLQRLKLKK